MKSACVGVLSVIETEGVYCAVRTGYLNVIHSNINL